MGKVGGACGPVDTVPPAELFPVNHVDVVAEDETADSARTSPSSSSLHNLPSDVPTALESTNCHFLWNVVIEETPKHARHPTPNPSPDGSTDSQPRRFQKADIRVSGFRAR